MSKHLGAPDLGLGDKRTLAMLEIGLLLAVAALGAFATIWIYTGVYSPQ
ncbi:hypothetical protein [Vitreimonas flagellata]|nr:hypothetical protein [Vitreimonas flagellata]